MKCPECQFDNREGAKFCKRCGAKLELTCPQCSTPLTSDSLFCDECGYDVQPPKEALDEISEPESPTLHRRTQKLSSDAAPIESERKHVTVLFSDLTGYTEMSERLDPEEVKEITTQIFDEISKIVSKYDGFIEKYAGDAVMAIFGVPKAHEDDPIRAVKVAREIHELVDRISPEVESRIGQSISMHTGINTGLVVTGEVEMERGTHGVEPTMVKGKADPVRVHKVISQKEKPITIRRLSGLRADLIGRKVELTELSEAVANLQEGKGRIFSICGGAGTGKSRLVEEFKATLDLEQIQWLEGHAYAYAQNIPYFPLIDLLNRVLHIEENDPLEKVREKVERGIENLIGKQEEIIPYVGSLYSLSYPEVEDVSPEFWKSRLQSAVKAILSALAKKTSTIYFLEDLHWADPSFVELLRQACLEIREPAIVLCVYRPSFSLFMGHQLSGVGKYYHEIQLQDLSRSEAQDMLESLLKTSNIPSDLRRLVQNKAEGNPFYLEELVNSLIESETLIRDNGHWRITESIFEADVSSSIHGLISGRLDRLDKKSKRIMQEASVIGRTFLYEILKRISKFIENIDKCLENLEQLDLIRTRALQPDLEYIFKHALTQEVAYTGILKKERREIHERIGLVIEKHFHKRLSEFYETISFHFKKGRSIDKAIVYLMKSGGKSLKRYAIEESHQYYKEAFELLNSKSNKSKEDDKLLIGILLQWAYVFAYRGDFKGLTDLLHNHKNLVIALDDEALLGMYYAWHGIALDYTGKPADAYKILHKALKLGEIIRDEKVIGYASIELTWNCVDLGFLDEAVACGERAMEASRLIGTDQDLYSWSRSALGYSYMCSGDINKVLDTGETLFKYGKKYSNIRNVVAGHWLIGCGYLWKGQFSEAIKRSNEALRLTTDPLLSLSLKFVLSWSHLSDGQFEKAEYFLKEIITFSKNFYWDKTGSPAKLLLGAVLITKGQMSLGLRMMSKIKNECLKNQRRWLYAYSEYLLGKLYLLIVEGTGPKNMITLVKNIGFLIKNVPFAAQKAENHFNKAIEVQKEIGAKLHLGLSYLDLGFLYKAKKRPKKALENIQKATMLFEECGTEGFLRQAKEALASFE
jgi:tetratricopeptide (TPR) repeat protein